MYIVCLAHFCELHGPTTIICTLTGNSGTLQPKNQACASCRMVLPSDTAINITSTAGDVAFVSTNYPPNPKRYSAVTKLVLKSLSVETTLDIAKPIFFGDVTNGYAIAKIFKIKDASARGSERKYSLLVIGNNETALLHNWDVVGMYFSEFISLIQKKVDVVAKAGSKDGLNNERYLRRSMTKPKSLVELTGDTDVFVKFHCWAIKLMKDMI